MSETIPLTDYAAAFVQALRQRTQVPKGVPPGTVSGAASSQKLVSYLPHSSTATRSKLPS